MWYSGADQDWADVRLTRDIAVPNNADARFNVWNNYVIEADWDFGFIEVSTDGGTTWTEQKVYTGADVEVSTPDGYGDPNGRMHDFGDKKYGLTGDSHGWRLDYVKLGDFAGQNIKLRLRLATDEAFLERGWFADDFSVTGGGATTWSDDAETDGDWVATVDTFTDTSGAGWHRDSGTSTRTHYYLAEWRNFDGFDKGLQYTYDSTYLHDAWKVEKIKYNAPGMLVWYRDTTWGNDNHVVDQPDGPAEHRLQGRPAPRRQPLRPVPTAGRGGRQGSIDPQQPPVATAVVEHRVRPPADVPVP